MFGDTKSLIYRYGQKITVEIPNENPKTSRAFIQPLRSDYQSALYEDYQTDAMNEQYLYIGIPNVKLVNAPSGTLIKTDLDTYTIKKIENVIVSGKVIYERAVLEKYSG